MPVFLFLKLELSHPGAQYCASVLKTPLLPQQAGFTEAQRLCIVAQTVLLTYMEQFIHLEKVINLVLMKRQTQYLMDNKEGIKRGTARLSSQNFLHLPAVTTVSCKISVMPAVPHPPALQSSPRA